MAVTKTINKKKKCESKKILDAVSGLQPQAVIEEIGYLQSSLQGTLAGLSAQISSKIEQMNNVDVAIQLKQDELAEMYNIEKEAMSLEQIKLERDEYETNWEKTRKDNELQHLKEIEERNLRWKRTQEEFEYQKEKEEKRWVEDFANEVAKHRRDEKIRQEDLEKSWSLIQADLDGKKEEFANLKATVDSFDAKLKTEVSKAEAIVLNRVKKEYENEVLMLKKDIESERLLNKTKVSALDETIEDLHAQIAKLQHQLEVARNDAKEVTNAALQSASGRQAMEALQGASMNANQKK